ncbi:VanZ family protein [Agromyces sp. G08B096]|uniref:VanZ family protein n=1 Tax=Agromyces sp. G08B096 TaxID=3156399 RepID=A0AAU7W8E6_9MICO
MPASTPLHEADTRTEPATRGRGFVAVLFAVYLALLVWLVLWKLQPPWIGTDADRVVKLVPFVAAGGEGASNPREVLANLLLFVPFGLYLGLLAPRWPWWRSTAVLAGVSLGLELAQFVLAVGSTDLTDVLVNTAGGGVGLALLALARRALRGHTAAVLGPVCAVGTAVAVLATVLVVASPVRFGPPDRGGLRDAEPAPHSLTP